MVKVESEQLLMTREFSVLGNFVPDTGVYPSILDNELTLTNTKRQLCYVFPFPTGADLGGELRFTIPIGSGYSSGPKLVLTGYIDGTPANTFAVGATQLGVDESESIDQAYETEDLANNSTWTGYADEDKFEIEIDLTPGSAYQEGDEVFSAVFRDDSVDDTTWNYLVTDIFFRFTEA